MHIIDAIESIEFYTVGIEFDDFSTEPMRIDACIRQISIIGEASNKLSKNLHFKYSQLPWPEIIALRNVVIHEYFGLDITIIWKIIHENIPEFKKQVLLIIDEM